MGRDIRLGEMIGCYEGECRERKDSGLSSFLCSLHETLVSRHYVHPTSYTGTSVCRTHML